MSNTPKQLIAVIAAMIAATGSAGFAMGESDVSQDAGSDVKSAEGSVRCEIQATPDSGGIILEGLVHADAPVNGSYRFQVITTSRSGRSNVSQGGNFSVGPNDAMSLGRVMVGNHNAAYDVNLEVTSNGETIACAKRIDGVI